MIDFIVSDTNQIILTVILSMVSVLVGYIIKQIKHSKQEGNGIRKGLRALLRTEILTKCNGLPKTGISVEEYDNIQKLYEAYRALGGNGTVDKLMKEIRDIPTKKE